MKLEVKELRKSFGETEVLHGVSFSVESGRALGLLGRNGAGKTTTIRILMNVFKFLYQLSCPHSVQEMKCECGDEHQKLCSWKDIRKECKGCPYLYFECQECGKELLK